MCGLTFCFFHKQPQSSKSLMVALSWGQEHNEVFRGISAAYALYRYSNFILPVCLFLHTWIPALQKNRV